MAVRAARERTFCRTREPAGVLEMLAWSRRSSRPLGCARPRLAAAPFSLRSVPSPSAGVVLDLNRRAQAELRALTAVAHRS